MTFPTYKEVKEKADKEYKLCEKINIKHNTALQSFYRDIVISPENPRYKKNKNIPDLYSNTDIGDDK